MEITLVLNYDSITVSSTWELTSVSMRYSQGDGVNTFLSRLVYYPRLVFCVQVYYDIIPGVPFLYVYGYLPWHGHVLPGTLIIKIVYVDQIYLQG